MCSGYTTRVVRRESFFVRGDVCVCACAPMGPRSEWGGVCATRFMAKGASFEHIFREVGRRQKWRNF